MYYHLRVIDKITSSFAMNFKMSWPSLTLTRPPGQLAIEVLSFFIRTSKLDLKLAGHEYFPIFRLKLF